MRRVGAALLVTAALVSVGLAPAAAAKPGAAFPAGTGGFIWPAPDAVSYAAKGTLTISWDAGEVVTDSWDVVRSSGPLDLDGGCADVSFSPETPVTTVATSLTLDGQLANRCYRYAVSPTAPAPATDEPTYLSGSVRTLSAWNGKYDLYRPGVFSTQQTNTWCVAASIQMMLNIIDGDSDHSVDSQRTYIRYARKNDQYLTPAAQGTDAQGWALSLTNFGGGHYEDVSNPRYKRSIRFAVRRLRQTGKPVGLVVAHSNHAWVLTGFESATDPALDHLAQIKALYVMGPLWPSTNSSGFDPRPNTRFTFEQLKRYHTRYYDSRGPNNPWEYTFVSILPQASGR